MRARIHSSSEREAATSVRRPAAATRGGKAHALQRSLGNRIVGHAIRSGGGEVPVPARVRGEAEARLGESLAAVRVRTDSPEAARLGTPAFTRGDAIHFAAGAFGRDVVRGHPVLRHELEHVGQQRRGEVPVTGHVAGIAVNTDPRLEQAANAPGPQAAREGPARPAVAVAQLYTYNGGNFNAQDQTIETLKAVLEAWGNGAAALTSADAIEVINALGEKCRAAGRETLGLGASAKMRINELALQGERLDQINDDAWTLIGEESNAVNHDAAKAPKNFKEKVAEVWDRLVLAFDTVDSAGAAGAWIKANQLSDSLESVTAVLGPLGVVLAALGAGANLVATFSAARRYFAAKKARESVHDDTLGQALEFARDENRTNAGMHLARAVIDACIVAFGIATLASAGWASPALAVAGLVGLAAAGYSWWARWRKKRKREVITQALWVHRSNAHVQTMLAHPSWGGFTADELAGNSPEFESKFLREVSDRLTPA